MFLTVERGGSFFTMATSTVMKILKSRSTHLVNFQPYPTRSPAKEVTKHICLFPLASLMCVCFMKTNKNKITWLEFAHY